MNLCTHLPKIPETQNECAVCTCDIFASVQPQIHINAYSRASSPYLLLPPQAVFRPAALMPLSLASACLLARRPLTLGVARQARLLSHGGGRFGAPKAWPRLGWGDPPRWILKRSLSLNSSWVELISPPNT